VETCDVEDEGRGFVVVDGVTGDVVGGYEEGFSRGWLTAASWKRGRLYSFRSVIL
jgi:hypothetical protein